MSAPDLLNTTLNFYIADISTAGQTFVPIPIGFDGEVIEIRTAINGAIITADADLTPKVNDVAMTNGLITVAVTGSAAGITDVSFPTGNNAVRVGEAVEIETDGASANTVEVFGTLVIRR